MSLLIIDGISASGKSLLLKKVQELLIEEKANYSKTIISEHLTERYFEDKKLNKESAEQHILEILRIINKINKIHTNSKFKNQKKVVTSIVERLFLTFLSKKVLDISFFERNKELIKELNIVHILLYIPEDLIYKRIKTTLTHRNTYWKDYIDSLGGIDAAVVFFKNQQNIMLNHQELLSKYMSVKTYTVTDTKDLQDTNIVKNLIE